MGKNVLSLPEPDTGNYGPAMQALRPRQRLFVEALLTQGDDNHTRAARSAGYADTPDAPARNAGFRLAHDEKVALAIKEEGDRRLRGGAILAASYVASTIGNEAARVQDRLKAAGMLLNRAGLPEVTRTETQSNVVHMTYDQAMERLANLREELRLPPAQVIEGEFTEVTDGREGLEDLL